MTTNLIDFLKKHGLPAVSVEGGIKTLDRYTKDRVLHEEAIVIPANIEAVRAFLGY